MGRPKTYDRDDVLRRAMTLFWDKGFAGAPLSELVEACGINRFSLYQEFGGKEGLFDAAIALYIRDVEALGAPLARDPQGVANVRAYFEGLLDFDFRLGCFAANSLAAKHVIPAPALARVQELMRSLEQLFLSNLRAAKRSGELAPDADIPSLARFLGAFEMGFLSHSILSRKRGERKRMLALLDAVLV